MQPSRIDHIGLLVSDLDLSVAWYCETLGLTHESTAGVPGGVAFMVAPTQDGNLVELLTSDEEAPPPEQDALDRVRRVVAARVQLPGSGIDTCRYRNILGNRGPLLHDV